MGKRTVIIWFDLGDHPPENAPLEAVYRHNGNDASLLRTHNANLSGHAPSAPWTEEDGFSFSRERNLSF
jgi:hypothetical protein